MTPRTNELGQPVGDPVPGWTPRRRPEPGPFHGRTCSVVPLQPAHAEELYGGCHGPEARGLWTYLSGLPGPFADVASFAEAIAGQVADPASESVAITVDGRAEGLASYLRIDPAHGSVEIGGILLGTRLRRTTAATEALYLLARHVLDDLGYTYIEGESILAEVDDRPGGMARLARALADANVNIYGHLFLGRWGDRATFAFVVDDPDTARPILERKD